MRDCRDGIDRIHSAGTMSEMASSRRVHALHGVPLGVISTPHGRMADADAIEQVRGFDAIYLGAIGDPRVPDHISARELILPFRQGFRQYVNLRPMRLLPGITSPLGGRTAADIDMICVRENSEGEYCGAGGRLHAGTADELAEQTGIFTRVLD